MKRAYLHKTNMDEKLSMRVTCLSGRRIKKSGIISGIMVFLLMSLVFSSCEDELEDVLIPSIELGQSTDINVGYSAGDTILDVTSNVIYYANVDVSSQSWLSCKFSDSCKILTVIYIENDTTIARSGKITLSKGDSSVVLTVNQEGNPNAGTGLKKVDIEYSINTGTYTVLLVSADQTAKIPVGATVVFECSGDVGSISLLDATYATYFSGSPVNGKIRFVWTKSMADKTATSGIMGLLNDGCPVTDMYCLYLSKDIAYTINAGTYTVLLTSAMESAKIPLGATVVFDCSSDVGSISLLDASYATYFSGSPVNGKIQFIWTQDMADKTAASGIMGLLNDGCPVTGMHYIYVKTDIAYTINTGTYTVLLTTAAESGKIPIGATLVFECASDAGSISLLDATYASYFSGSPVDGKIECIWTMDMVTKTAASGIMGLINDGCTITDMYCHN